MRNLASAVAFFALVLFISQPAAAGPESFTRDGFARRWLQPVVTLRWQPSRVAGLSSEQFGNAVMTAFQTWTALPSVALVVKGEEDRSLDGLSAGKLYQALTTPRDKPVADITIALDHDGQVRELLTKLGWAAEDDIKSLRGYVFEPNRTSMGVLPRGFRSQAMLILNWTADNEITRVLLHEAGHALGLGHSALRVPGVTGVGRTSAPIMMPVVINSGLFQDDIIWMSTLYPSELAKADFGRLNGIVFDQKRVAQHGVLVRARLLVSGRVSDTHEYTFLTLPARRGGPGKYSFFLPAGHYQITFEMGDPRFTEGYEDGLRPSDRAVITAGAYMLIEVLRGKTIVANNTVENPGGQ